jgi:hypothetical protein
MVSLLPLQKKYLTKITAYKPRKIVYRSDEWYIQTADNCWAYYMLNNLYFNTWIKVDNIDFEKYIKSYGINPLIINDGIDAAVILCQYVKDKLQKNIVVNQFSVLSNSYLFANLLMNWYSIWYLRDCWINTLKDIWDDDEINNIIKRTVWSQHYANVCFRIWRLHERWTRWDNNKYNEFTFKNTDLFIDSAKTGWIRHKVLFIDFA